MIYQRTVSQSVGCKGVGLHTGDEIHLTIHPAPADSGIVFMRSDMPNAKPLKASLENVVSTSFSTTLGHGEFTVGVVEHLLSALCGMGIDNAIVELDGDEVPIMDGSAEAFVELLRVAGNREQGKPRRYMVIRKTIEVCDGDKKITIHPSREFRISCAIDYDHQAIGNQAIRFNFSGDFYESEIAKARTFGFLNQIHTMKANGFAAGGALDNAVVVGTRKVLNSDGLRFPDEFVRHKALDTIGDLYLLGMPVIGHLITRKAGHTLNNRFNHKIVDNPKKWKIVEFGETRQEAVTPGFCVVPSTVKAR